MKTLRRRQGSFGRRPDWRTYQSRLKQTKGRGRSPIGVYRYVIVVTVLLSGCFYAFNGTFVETLSGLWETAVNSSRSKPAAPPPEVVPSAPGAVESVPGDAAPAPEIPASKPRPAAAAEDGTTRDAETGETAVHAAAAFGGDPVTASEVPTSLIDKAGIQTIFDRRRFVNLSKSAFDYDLDGHRYHIDTSIDTKLQQYMLGELQPQYAHSIGIVIMEPDTGRILTMVSHDREDPNNNACTESLFPAASIFKIVTAAAAVEEYGLQPDSTVTYSGAKHTLYKSQLNRKNQRNVNRISLRDSFAQSVNPVFGKLGAQYLGKKGLMSHAEAFGFNQEIDFELPMAASSISVSDEPYNWAEIASGFNRSTRLSPLHGAIMASAVVANQGRLVEPSIVDRIVDSSGRVIYRSRPKTLNQALSPETSRAMRSLMKETVLTGTCRKSFRGIADSPVLSRLNIGGKSGSINSKVHAGRRFDWFVGYAEEKEGHRKIVISIVVAHQNYIGIKSNMYARMAIEKFFEDVGPRI